MKTFIKKFIQYTLLASVFFGGALVVDAFFHSDPGANGTGFTSIGSSSNAKDTHVVNINTPGASADFNVYVDYQNIGSNTLFDVRAGVDFTQSGAGNSTSITGFLRANNASYRSDTTTLSGLPSSWSLEARSARKVNTHVGGVCGNNYNYDTPVNISSATSSNGAYIGNLDTVGRNTDGDTGACSQGHLVVSFRVTNTETQNTYSWSTGNWGSCINGIQTRIVECRDSNGNPVPDSRCTGLRPPTQQSCSLSLAVETREETDVLERSAQLNGRITQGNPDEVWFVYDTVSSVNCSTSFRHPVTPVSAGNNIFLDIPNNSLEKDTRYYYRACAAVNGRIVSGGLEDFQTGDSRSGNGTKPDVRTYEESSLTNSSAKLRGNIDMNSFRNGIAFFVYGQDEDEINDVDRFNNEYSEIDTNGEKIRKVIVDNDFDGEDNISRSVFGLEEGERYYYRACVEYEDGSDIELACGGTENFRVRGNSGNGNVEIRTEAVTNVRSTSATICGNLLNNGGNSRERTWLEIWRSGNSASSGVQTKKRERGSVRYYCEDIQRLTPGTNYVYRACSDSRCASTRTFRTPGTGVSSTLVVNTMSPLSVSRTSAVLQGYYVGNPGESTRLWFNWGRTSALGTTKSSFTRTGNLGSFQDDFTNLTPCTNYYYQAVAQNSTGTKYGDIIRFRTSGCVTTVTPPEPEIEVVEKKQEDIDLSLLGLGLSLLRLEIDDDRETVARGDQVRYEVSWENISTIDLNDIDVKVEIPREVQITNTSRGRIDADDNVVLFNIDDLNEDESGSMTISGLVGAGTVGNSLTAEATAAFDNPINDAQENATDYDIDEYVVLVGGVTASVFGLGNITFLGWLTILLGLLIIFLIARWLYLEREDLRAQAYMNGYGRPAGYDPRFDAPRPAAPAEPVYRDAPTYPQDLPGDEGEYTVYRPNR